MTMDSGLPAPSPTAGHGPRILFFSGGSALRDVSHVLPAWTGRSIHLVTPFDSGGSSAALRHALHMPAVGDLRNRVLALAAHADSSVDAMLPILGHRLPTQAPATHLVREIQEIRDQAPAHVEHYLSLCLAEAGRNLDLRHASVGNLVLTGAYLEHGQRLDTATRTLSRLVRAQGTVLPVALESRHLALRTRDGTVVTGQHRITAGAWREAPAEEIYLVASLDDATPAPVAAPKDVVDLIATADLIVYPVGSFLTSVLASLLPSGIADAVAASPAPKVYVPNAGHDPEEAGLTLDDRVRVLVEHLQAGGAADPPATSFLQYVLVDEKARRETTPDTTRKVERMGIQVVAAPLVGREAAPLFHPARLVEALMSLVPLP